MIRRLHLLMLLFISCTAVAVEQVQVVGLFSNKAMLMIDGQRRMLSVGETSPEGVTLISADSDQALLEIDGERQALELGSQISSRFTAAEKKVVHIYPDPAGMYRVSGSINGSAVGFLVDTGASSIAMSSVEAERLGVDYRNGKVGMAETASSRVKAYSVVLNKVDVGGIRLYGVRAVVLEGNMPSQILLGQSFLNRLNMQREGVLLRLEQNL